jgi:MFS superfamily sulfate permease-like transporter
MRCCLEYQRYVVVVLKAFRSQVAATTWTKCHFLDALSLFYSHAFFSTRLPLFFKQTIPASVAAVTISTILEYVLVRPLGYQTYTVNDFGPMQPNRALLPIWVKSEHGGGYDTTLPPVDTKLLGEIFLTAFFTAFIGLFESLLTMQIIDELTESKGSANREACGQGLGQICCGIFGGMGGCTTIGQSLMNMHSGGYTRLSSSVAGLVLLLITVIAYPLINLVPVASLAGVMFLVSFFT